MLSWKIQFCVDCNILFDREVYKYLLKIKKKLKSDTNLSVMAVLGESMESYNAEDFNIFDQGSPSNNCDSFYNLLTAILILFSIYVNRLSQPHLHKQ